MKRLFALLYATFPAVLLLAQTPPTKWPAVGPSTPEIVRVEKLRSMQKRFPPEMMTFSQTPAGHDVKLSRSYCVYQNPDRKSISLKRCEPVPLRLISPFGAAMPKKGAAK